jgi:heterodisulfide reductase subunit A
VHTTLSGEETGPALARIIDKVTHHPRIKTHLNAKIKKVSGYVGNFKTELEENSAAIDHGVVIIASGADQYEPVEYCYGKDDRVITQRDLEELLHASDAGSSLETSLSKIPQSAIRNQQSVVMIQCVGSRDDKRDYCSRVCCSNAIKNAIRLKDLNPKISVYVLFRDMRSYGLREKYYRLAREKGVIFIRFEADEKPEVLKKGDELVVTVDDVILGKTVRIKPGLVVLSAGIVANPDNKVLSQFLKVPLESDGYFLEAHVKLRPVDFATDGIFVCGLAHYPKDIGETIAQARAAAGRAATVLSKNAIESEGRISSIRAEMCSGCGTCVAVCAYNALELDPVRNIAVVNEALCKGCGACAASCRAGAIDLNGFKNEQILSMLSTI